MRWKPKKKALGMAGALAASATILALVAAAVVVALTPDPARAHGSMMAPGARTYLCWIDGLSPQGNIVPQNPACGAAVTAGGPNALYNWFGVLRSDGAGRTVGFIPDGQLCSGGNTTYSGFDIARGDYPVTHLTSGASFNWRHSNWAAHPGTFYMYVTRDTWSPTRPLAWSDLESTPFLQVTNPPQNGSPGTADGHYYWTGPLPSNKSGRHIIYTVWARSDSAETFYGCSDVTFDGGNGTVTGIGSGGTGSISPSGGSSVSPSGGSPGTRTCAAAYRQVSSWNGGFQGEVTITNPGSASIAGWTVSWTPVSGQTIQQLWGGRHAIVNGSVTVQNETWNGTVTPTGSSTFGFVASGTATTPTLTCVAA